ncbi:hypothetical protein sce8326 [Sorangium cellulosum So ce56]|uniref:Uncharacterized protein n=2 Tax=Polyangiaceae TaxID=49 RepID=A9FT63_SORC5|nr:hypothetical protein sce8326 [Sorangium cellulosum So ce56]
MGRRKRTRREGVGKRKRSPKGNQLGLQAATQDEGSAATLRNTPAGSSSGGWLSSMATGLLSASMFGQTMADDPASPVDHGERGGGWSPVLLAGTAITTLATGALAAYWWSQSRPARPQFALSALTDKTSDAYKAMTEAHPLNEGRRMQTCYDTAVFSLTLTDGLSPEVFMRWKDAIPKANTYLIVDPTRDPIIRDPDNLPRDSIIAFYRRFLPGVGSRVDAEVQGGWIVYHMVRTYEGRMVLGSNNGDRRVGAIQTNPTWSLNDIAVMFDWNNEQSTQTVWTAQGVPLPSTFGVKGREEYVAFYAPISTVIDRLNAAFR